MNRELLKVSLRQQAMFIDAAVNDEQRETTARTLALVSELHGLGFGVSERLLRAIDVLNDDDQQTLLDVMNEVMGTKLNWASLTRGWLVPTGETVWDHFVTLMANVLGKEEGGKGKVERGGGEDATVLPCGHIIPAGTFDLARYNGCPFCGTPLDTADWTYRGQGTKLRELQLWGDGEMRHLLSDLLQSPVPLDATQRDTLRVLLNHYDVPEDADIKMKETRMLVVSAEIDRSTENVERLLATPTDVLRYLWYRHTGQVELVEPRTLLHIARKNQHYEWNTKEDIERHAGEERERLKLKYDRTWCRRVAQWLNRQPLSTDQQLEAMHPKREMWVRMIRALRLSEYARKPGYEHLRELLDRFYRKDYTVFQGRVDYYRLKNDCRNTLLLLQQRPGLFARCLFATMLTFGREPVIAAFRKILPQIPPRLLLSLGGTADIYFDRQAQRIVRPLSGIQKTIPPHPLLKHYTDEELATMRHAVNALYLDAMRQHFESQSLAYGARSEGATTIYIAPELDDIPVGVGDRSSTIQDTSCALQGTRFHVAGDAVRLFLQWGAGLPAQHLDMDLSCYLLSESPPAEVCAYYNLSPEGCRHSGDIQRIPDQVGTAEYIELQLPVLEQRGIKRVVFTCNAYTAGKLQPNLVVGWMSAAQPMQVSNEKGVAYDPSTVQHSVRISESNLSKGLIFGVLDVSKREITWLEMPFDGQTVASVSPEAVDAYLRRLRAKPTIGQVLRLKAEVQGLALVSSPDEADEVFTLLWAQNPAAVSKVLL